MVYGVKELPNITFINVGAKYPDNPLTIVVFPGDKGNFKEGLAVYDNKNICVTGLSKNIKASLKSLLPSHKIFSMRNLNTRKYNFNVDKWMNNLSYR